MIFPQVLAALLGLVIGSFLNVVVCRHGTGRSVAGRSGCLSCGRPLGVPDLIPVLSWLCLRGRCRRCDAKISAQYPLVELGGALAFWLAYRAHPFLAGGSFDALGALVFLAAAVSLAALVAIVAYDLRHKIIPDRFSAVFAAAAVARVLVVGLALGVSPASWATALLAGPIVALPLFLLWAVSSGRWMGLGDPKLALGIGWLVGASGGALALFAAFVSGALVGGGAVLLARIRSRRGLSMRSELPFAPFLAFGAALAFATGWGIPEILAAASWASAPIVVPLVDALIAA